MEEYEYDTIGKEVHYYNFETGVFRLNGQSANIDRYLELKQKADSILISSYGQSIFDQYILSEFSNCEIHYFSKPVDWRNGGKDKYYGVSVYERWWFEELEANINDVAISFPYKLFLNNRVFEDITIRMSLKGELLIENFPSPYGIGGYGTLGLPNNPKTDDILQESKVMDLAIQNGFPQSKKEGSQLMWTINKSLRSGEKELFYQLCYDKYLKKTNSCYTTYCDAWLVSPYSKEIIKDKEIVLSSDCAVVGISRKTKNGKFGFHQRFGDETLIPYEYDVLSKKLYHFMVAKKNSYYGCINRKNEVIIPFEYDLIQLVPFKKQRFADDFVIVEKEGRFGLYNSKGEVILPIKYSKLEKETENSITGFKKNKPKVTFNFKTGLKN